MKPVHSILLLLLSLQPQSAQLQQETDWDQELLKLEQHRQLWNDKNVHDYRFVLDKSCYGCWWYFPAQVVVEQDEVAAVLDSATGEPKRARTPEGREREGSWEPPPPSLDMYLTVEQLFDLVEDAIENHWGTTHPGRKTRNFSVEYDERHGYPLAIQGDYSRSLDSNGIESHRSDSTFTYAVSQFSEE